MPTILLVCSANVCRSQYARALLAAATTDGSVLVPVVVESAGTAAVLALEPCPLVRDLVGHTHVDLQSTPLESPKQLSLDQINAANLILTAERAQRAVVGKLRPQSRLKTFTLIEATLLARRALDNGHFDLDIESPAEERFVRFVSQLNDTRGLYPVAVPARLGRLAQKHRRPAPLDIGDQHDGRMDRHRAVLHEVAQAVKDLTDVMKLAAALNRT